MSATIRVTADHIQQGERSNPMACPIALALIGQWGGEDSEIAIDVFDGHAFASGPPVPIDGVTAALPDEADAFVLAFDEGRPVQPFEFAITWIDDQGCEVQP